MVKYVVRHTKQVAIRWPDNVLRVACADNKLTAVYNAPLPGQDYVDEILNVVNSEALYA